jgi:rhodanese-related sulfurtransferase
MVRRAMMAAMPPTAREVPDVTRDELIRGLRAGRLTLVDVLSPESFAAAHIPGAINLPVAALARRAADALPRRDAVIVTYCGGPT